MKGMFLPVQGGTSSRLYTLKTLNSDWGFWEGSKMADFCRLNQSGKNAQGTRFCLGISTVNRDEYLIYFT